MTNDDDDHGECAHHEGDGVGHHLNDNDNSDFHYVGYPDVDDVSFYFRK